MYYSNIKYNDIANGKGVRTTLFVSGCRHRCKGCFNPETWSFTNGELFTVEVAEKIIESMRPYWIEGLTLLGGEPFEPENQRELVKLLHKFRQEFGDTKNVWAFTGGVFEHDLLNDESSWHCEVTEEMLSMIDVLVDGPFIEELKNISLQFRGSSNQRVIDMQKTLKTGEVVLLENIK